MSSANKEKQAINKTILKSVVLVAAMFAFALWVMPPIYTLFCDVTGLNGKTKGQYTAVSADVDQNRIVTVHFVGTNNENMPWGFKPSAFELKVHPGQLVVTHFVAHNPTKNIMVGQAVPSLVPHNATDYFHKTVCFCFHQQALAPGETADLGLQFIVDQDVPKGVNTITLSYTLFDVTETSPQMVEQKRLEIQNKKESELTDSQTLTAR